MIIKFMQKREGKKNSNKTRSKRKELTHKKNLASRNNLNFHII